MGRKYDGEKKKKKKPWIEIREITHQLPSQAVQGDKCNLLPVTNRLEQ